MGMMVMGMIVNAEMGMGTMFECGDGYDSECGDRYTTINRGGHGEGMGMVWV